MKIEGMKGYPASVRLEVRYRDLDPLGHVNNAVYLSYIELARVRYFALLGALEGALGKGEAPVVARVEIDYHRPIFLEDEVVAAARVSRLGRTSFAMDYRVEAGGELAASARSVHVWIGRNGKPTPLPEHLRRRVGEIETLPVEGL